jgi:hypothetical protein
MLAVSLLIAAQASAAQPGPLVGIGEQKSGMFASRQWNRLGLRDARYMVPWDALQDPYQLALLDTWLAAAKRAHARVLISFVHSLRSIRRARILPTQRQFERQFKRFRQRYPWVREWLAWNEANNPGALTARQPRRAAEYFDAVARNCRGCRIVAADVLDTRNMASWVTRFLGYAHAPPRIWGLHNYGDANGMSARGTQTLLTLTRGQIWFTETGGVVRRRLYSGRRVLHTYRYSLEHAAQSTAHVLRLTCLSPRIARVYLYHWQAPLHVTSWDSGLLDRRGRPRPAYWIVRNWLRRAAAAGGGRRGFCRGPLPSQRS